MSDSNTLMTVLGLAGNAATGGIVGLLGSIGSGIVSIFQSKSQFKHDEMMAEMNLRLVAAQSEAASKVSADQLKTMMEQQSGQAFTASQTAAGMLASNVPPFIAGVISLWRPTLTAMLMGCTAYFYQSGSAEMRDYITEAVVTLAGVAVSWWFGSRQMEKFLPGKVSVK